MGATADQVTLSDEQTDSRTNQLVTQTGESEPPRLDLLDDKYSREILVALCHGPQRGRELITACSASRSTVYRRLNRLQAAGFLMAETVVETDGHHCDAYRLVWDRLTVHIDADSLTVTVQSTGNEST